MSGRERPMHGAIRCPMPSCGGLMVPRVNKAIGSEFLGCDQYPRCTETMPIPESVWMRKVGAPELPLFNSAASYYSDIRKGNRIPSPEMLGRFAEVLETPLEPLLWLWVEQHMDRDQARRLARWLREP